MSLGTYAKDNAAALLCSDSLEVLHKTAYTMLVAIAWLPQHVTMPACTRHGICCCRRGCCHACDCACSTAAAASSALACAQDDPQRHCCHCARHAQPQQAVLDHPVVNIRLQALRLAEVRVVLAAASSGAGRQVA